MRIAFFCESQGVFWKFIDAKQDIPYVNMYILKNVH